MDCSILWAASFTLYNLAAKNLHVVTTFLQLVAKGDLRIFLILNPDWMFGVLFSLVSQGLSLLFLCIQVIFG